MKHLINGIISTLTTIGIYIFGEFDIALQCFLVAIVLDYLTGVLDAGYNKRLSSKIGLKGIFKKIALLCLIALAVVIDKITAYTGHRASQ